MRVYYAHSRRIYGTEREKDERSFLESFGNEVICPNRDVGERGDIAPYLQVLQTCDVVVCSEVEHPVTGKPVCGVGVFQEVRHALRRKIPVMVLRTGKARIAEVVKNAVVVDPDDLVYHARILTE